MAAITEPFASGNSFIHRIDPRTRLLAAAFLTVPVALLNTLPPSIGALGFGLGLAVIAKLPLLKLLHRLAVVNTFILFLWFFLPFSMSGSPVLTLGPLIATTDGIDLSLLITLKSNAVILILMSLVGSIRIQDLGPALRHLKVPPKLCHILLFTYRYIFVIFQEYLTMRQAMTARGFCPGTNSHTYRSYAWLVGMLLVKSWDRAERVHDAMCCRGFKGQFYSLTQFSTTKKDVLFLIGCSALSLLLAFTELSQIGL